MLQIFIALNLAALIGLCVWRPEPEPKPKPVCLMSPAELWELFAGLDADGSGSLDGEELGALLKTIGAVAFTHPLGFLLLVGAASIGVRACLRRGRRTLTAVCIAANACAGARLAYHWNDFSFCCIPFFLTAAAVGRLHGAERRSFGTVSIRRISIFTVRRMVSGALVLAVHRALGLRLRVARRALGRRRVLADDLDLAIAAARGRRALARCATH